MGDHPFVVLASVLFQVKKGCDFWSCKRRCIKHADAQAPAERLFAFSLGKFF
ncbi:hypothetical protein NBRC111894_4317 [Sporolactobacillus inulinus]|uniref:Uncharacterized protein n=1 Tax=Sporolactobacillus inulinus TaxID=2078 RepID=A0A4Y1ZIF8_9BACL|nr:hypothetical protein NBRC111894_4317 [Sporolactobacillus inulinus]